MCWRPSSASAKSIRPPAGPCPLARGLVRAVNTLAAWGGFHHRLEAWRDDPLAVNRIDAAVARPQDEADLLPEVLDIGIVRGTRPPELGLKVRKSGRSSGLTTGEIIVLDATITVGYGESTARFAGQIVTAVLMRSLTDKARFVGVNDGLEAGIEKLESGDIIFLCTDGLIGADRDPNPAQLYGIRMLLMSDLPIGSKVQKAIASALARGEKDNITCLAALVV